MMTDIHKHPLHIWRKKNGVTQERAAADLKVSTSTLVKWEAGQRSPRPDKLSRIEIYTGGEVTPNEFFQWLHIRKSDLQINTADHGQSAA